jgi:hypothetical protein
MPGSNIHDQRADDFVARKCDRDARIQGACGYLASQDGRSRDRCIRHRLFVMRSYFREVRRESDDVSRGEGFRTPAPCPDAQPERFGV